MFNTNNHIASNNKLTDLIDVLVPEKFKESSPEFYDIMYLFLENAQNVQNSINVNFIDRIDIDRITSEEILNIYMDSYMATLKMPHDEDIILIKDVIKMSKDLSTKKGTVLLFNILTRILFYIVPDIKTLYQEMLDEYNSEDTSESRKLAILDQIEVYKKENLVNQYIEINEIDMFVYEVELSFKTILYNEYIKPFCHPAGWNVISLAKIYNYFSEHYQKNDNMTIQAIYLGDSLKYYHFDYVLDSPTDYVSYDAREGTPVVNTLNTDVQTKAIIAKFNGDVSEVDEWKSKVSDPTKIEYDTELIWYKIDNIQPIIDTTEKVYSQNISIDNTEINDCKYQDTTISQDDVDFFFENQYTSNSLIKSNSGFVANGGKNFCVESIRVSSIENV